MNNQPPLIVIVGETASGKSSLAMQIALANRGEIICADSRTVYKGLDVGTAKPSKDDQKTVKHHLLDIISPDETYNAARFQRDANKAIDDIYSRNHLPVMVGGTGLFIDSVLFDFKFGHKSDPQKRANLEAKTTTELRDEALKIEKNLDFGSLSNRRHLIRLIETGQIRNQDNKMRDNTIIIGLKVPKNVLRKQIEKRVEVMFRRGLRKEVDDLILQHNWDSEALTGVGYAEFKPYYEGEISMSEVKKNIVRNTLRYAKRQRTWFKRNLYINWFENADDALVFVNNRLTEQLSATND